MGHGYSPLLHGLYEKNSPAGSRNELPAGLSLQRTAVFVRVAKVREIGRPYDQGIAGESDFYLTGAAFHGIPTPKKAPGLLPSGLRPETEPVPDWDGDLIEAFRDRVIQEASETTNPWRILAIADPGRLAAAGGVLSFVLRVGEEDFGPDASPPVAPATTPQDKGRRTELLFQYDTRTRRVSFPDTG